MIAIRERIVRFGARESVAGILSAPAAPRVGVPSIILVNAGITHRVGPSRLYVDVARGLSARGFTVLRFDQPGLGDSIAVTTEMTVAASAVSSVRTALDYLERTRQTRSFVVCGLCSGADHSLLTAFGDDRVVGLVLIDPTVSRTFRSNLIHHLRRFQHPATWGSVIRLRHPIWNTALRRRSLDPARNLPVPVQPQRESEAQVLEQLQQTVDRGVQLMFVFTGGLNQQYNYRNQLFDLLPGIDFRGQLRLEFMADTDHSISDAAGRTTFLQAMGDWLCSAFTAAERVRETM